jgi:carbonic anhydrase
MEPGGTSAVMRAPPPAGGCGELGRDGPIGADVWAVRVRNVRDCGPGGTQTSSGSSLPVGDLGGSEEADKAAHALSPEGGGFNRRVREDREKPAPFAGIQDPGAAAVQCNVRPFVSAITLALALAGLTGCEKIQGLMGKAPEAAASADAHGKAPEPKSEKEGKEAKGKDAKEDAHARTDAVHENEDPEEFALPFAWEASAAEPLGRTRTFLRDTFSTNTDYMQLGTKLFQSYADRETPRATVLTCADSRVHTTAFDASPENDDYIVRNIGNQIETSAGSVEYGVEQLNTPLLLILGHTGCTAVKAAMDGSAAKLGPEVEDELGHIHVPKKDAKDAKSAKDAKKEAKRPERDVWAEAVVSNVHDQVDAALERFGKRVHSGKLTVVGAVLDIRNDIGLGAGRLILVDVNGNRDQERISAFIEAVTGRRQPKKEKEQSSKDDRSGGREGKDEKDSRSSSSRKESAADLADALAALIPSSKRTAKSDQPHDPEEEHASGHR